MNGLAELLGFLSGLALLVPAFRANWFRHRLQVLKTWLAKSNAEFDRKVGKRVEADLENRQQSWSPADDRFLKAGAVLFALSGLLKLLAHSS